MAIPQEQVFPVMDCSDPSPVHGYAVNREQAITCYLHQFDAVDRPARRHVDCNLIDGVYRVTAARSLGIH
jgi:hypothetical protein